MGLVLAILGIAAAAFLVAAIIGDSLAPH